jgi:hypothetical protein
MYESYAGLSGKPFQPAPTLRSTTAARAQARVRLSTGCTEQGFIVITGEIGGKTTIVRSLLEQLDAAKVVAAQLGTQLDADDLLRAVAMALGCRSDARQGHAAGLDRGIPLPVRDREEARSGGRRSAESHRARNRGAAMLSTSARRPGAPELPHRPARAARHDAARRCSNCASA